MLKIQSVNHVSEHLSAIYPVYTLWGGSVAPAFGAYRGEGISMLASTEACPRLEIRG